MSYDIRDVLALSPSVSEHRHTDIDTDTYTQTHIHRPEDTDIGCQPLRRMAYGVELQQGKRVLLVEMGECSTKVPDSSVPPCYGIQHGVLTIYHVQQLWL
jgi:hypothetical protein